MKKIIVFSLCLIWTMPLVAFGQTRTNVCQDNWETFGYESYEQCLADVEGTPPATTANTTSLTDVPTSHPHYTAIAFVVQGNIASGINGSFYPDNPVTRAEFMKFMINATNKQATCPEVSASTFTDVANNHSLIKFIQCGANLGWIRGYGDGRFGPQDNVTRGQASKILVNAVGFTPPVPTEQLFTDAPLNNDLTPFIHTTTLLGLIDIPANSSTFGNNVSLNRGEVAEMIYRSAVVGQTNQPYGQATQFQTSAVNNSSSANNANSSGLTDSQINTINQLCQQNWSQYSYTSLQACIQDFTAQAQAQQNSSNTDSASGALGTASLNYKGQTYNFSQAFALDNDYAVEIITDANSNNNTFYIVMTAADVTTGTHNVDPSTIMAALYFSDNPVVQSGTVTLTQTGQRIIGNCNLQLEGGGQATCQFDVPLLTDFPSSTSANTSSNNSSSSSNNSASNFTCGEWDAHVCNDTDYYPGGCSDVQTGLYADTVDDTPYTGGDEYFEIAYINGILQMRYCHIPSNNDNSDCAAGLVPQINFNAWGDTTTLDWVPGCN